MTGEKLILMAWELGGGLGHINKLLPIVRAITCRGYRVAFAFRTLRGTDRLFEEFPKIPVFPTPTWNPDSASEDEMDRYSCNYADLLLRAGYGSLESLGALVDGWCDIFRMTEPSLVVCDHSPTAILAAAGRIPVVHFGSGFTTPPVGRPLLRLDEKFSRGVREREEQVLQAVQWVQMGRGAPVPQAISAIFNTAENFTCCLPELDPYRRIRAIPAMGPIHRLPNPHPLGESTSLFGYLGGSDHRVPSVLASLVKAEIPCGIYVRELDPEWQKLVEGSQVTLYDQPQNLPEALSAASAVIHHGGLATTETALAIGRPQFLLPRHLEQTLTADTVQTMGCGLNLSRSKGDVGEIIRMKLRRFDKNTASLAARIDSRPAADVVAMIVDACAKHLDGRR